MLRYLLTRVRRYTRRLRQRISITSRPPRWLRRSSPLRFRGSAVLLPSSPILAASSNHPYLLSFFTCLERLPPHSPISLPDQRAGGMFSSAPQSRAYCSRNAIRVGAVHSTRSPGYSIYPENRPDLFEGRALSLVHTPWSFLRSFSAVITCDKYLITIVTVITSNYLRQIRVLFRNCTWTYTAFATERRLHHVGPSR